MATNYYNVLDRPNGFTQDSYGTVNWLTPTEPDTSARELGNTNSKAFLPSTGHNSWFGDYNITSFITPTYSAVATRDSLATGTDVTNTASTTTFDTFPASTGAIYIGMNIRFNRFTVDMTADVNTGTAGAMTVSYWNGSGWTACTISDGTSAASKTFAKDGDVYFGTNAAFGLAADWVTGTLADIAAAGGAVPSRTSEYFWVKVTFAQNFSSNVETNYIRGKSPGFVSLFAGIYYQPTQADDATVSVMDMTAASFSDGHTGYIQGIAFALYYAATGSSTTNLGGYCYSCWPTYYIGTNRVITQLTAINIQNTGGTVNGTITNYTGVAVGTMSHNVTTNWKGVHVVGYSGTSTNGDVTGLHVGTLAGTISANDKNAIGLKIDPITTTTGLGGSFTGAKIGVFIGAISGTGLLHIGIWVDKPISGVVNSGIHIAGAGMTVLGRVREYFTNTDVDATNNTLTVAQIIGGIVTHTSVTGAGTITLDTAANIIAGSSGNGQLWADNQTITVLYINDGTQTLSLGGTPTGITYAAAGITIAANEAAIIYITRTSSTTCTVRLVGA